jgi:hypothetical protein
MAAHVFRRSLSTLPVIRVATFSRTRPGQHAHLIADDFFEAPVSPPGRQTKNTRATELGMCVGMQRGMQ